MFGGEGRKRPILQSSPIRPASDFDLRGGWGVASLTDGGHSPDGEPSPLGSG